MEAGAHTRLYLHPPLYILREMLTSASALKALVKELKVETLSWILCFQHTEKLKSNFFYKKFSNC